MAALDDLDSYSFNGWRADINQQLDRLAVVVEEARAAVKLNAALTLRLNQLKEHLRQYEYNPNLSETSAELQRQLKLREDHVAILQRQIMMQKKDINRLITRNKELKDFIRTRISQLAGIMQGK